MCGSQESITYSINLIQDLPLFIGHIESFGCLDGSLHLTSPDLEVANVLLLDEVAQLLSKLEEENKNLYLFIFTIAHAVRRKTGKGLEDIFSLIVKFHCTSFPLIVRPESPPIRPLTFSSLSPWRHR